MQLKYIIPFIVLGIGLGGCLSKTYFVLSTPSLVQQSYTSKSMVLGIEQVMVPKYFFKREIAVAQSSSRVTFLAGASWAEELDEGLTQRLISFMQKKFNQPDVYAYPWGVDRQPTHKIKVHITRFITQGDKVYLDASWEIKSMIDKKRKSKLFSKTLHTELNAENIVATMDRAFGALEKDIAKGLYRF